MLGANHCEEWRGSSSTVGMSLARVISDFKLVAFLLKFHPARLSTSDVLHGSAAHGQFGIFGTRAQVRLVLTWLCTPGIGMRHDRRLARRSTRLVPLVHSMTRPHCPRCPVTVDYQPFRDARKVGEI